MAPTDHAPFGAPTVWVVTEEAFWKRTTSPRKTVRFAGEKAKFETVTMGPRTAVAVADGAKVADAVAVLEAVAVDDAVGEMTAVFVAVDVATGVAVTAGSTTVIVPAIVG